MSVAQDICAEEADESEGKNVRPIMKPYVFYRLKPSTFKTCPSIFRIGKGQNLKPSAFQIIKGDAQSKPSIYNRIKNEGESLKAPCQALKCSVFNHLRVGNERQISIPSCIE